jgi:hypothetical protein
VSERPVRVILDASAIVAFTRGSVGVGETLAKVNDEGAAAGLPVLCLVQTIWAVADRDQMDLLINHEATVLARGLLAGVDRALTSPGQVARVHQLWRVHDGEVPV